MDPATVAALPQSLSSPRFRRYQKHWPGRDDVAIRHYLWNVELSTAYWGPICILEVALRNALNDQMKSGRREDWWNTTQLAPHEAEALKRTIEKLFDKYGFEPHADDVVAATSLGFWVGMLSGGIPRHPDFNYETKFWQTRLFRAFPNITKNDRKWLHGELLQIKALRNRIAHHEPISHFNHTLMISRVVSVLRALDSSLADYVTAAERVNAVVERKQAALSDGDCLL